MKNAKTIIAVILAVLMISSLAACGKDIVEDDFCGTWKVEYIEYEGSKFSVEEWKNMDEEDLSDFYVIFKDGGKAYVYDDEYGDLVNWLKSDDSIMLGDEKGTIVDEKICFDYYGDMIYLKKESDNQEIPKEEVVDDGEDIIEDVVDDVDTETEDESDPVEEESESLEPENTYAESNGEWKEFLKDYEAWVDDYIDVVKKYKENPADLTILSDYTEMVQEMADWSDRADEIELELEDTDAAIEYSTELLRIAGKLAQAY